MNNHTRIIAEAGVNHNGDLNLAKKLIDEAAASGADFVKFQTFKAKNLAAKGAPRAAYQNENLNNSDDQFEMLKKIELKEEHHQILKDYCELKKIEFLSSPFDHKAVHFLNELGVSLFKIPSGEITNFLILREVASLKKEIILSTGMTTLEEIRQALDLLIRFGAELEQITLLHCNTDYPTSFSDVNLLAMNHIRSEFKVKAGYSDHTLGIEVPIAAVALGATVIEKHFTLDKTMPGPDHVASLEPSELRSMVVGIRNIEQALGSSQKMPTESELRNKTVVRKSIVANRKIEVGEILNEENLIVKRPGTGICPMKWEEVVGTNASKNFNEDELIEF